tara:strand:+ start:919 stop:1269 length:351 start_codon:yes stop_codon:yes gene_type:complete
MPRTATASKSTAAKPARKTRSRKATTAKPATAVKTPVAQVTTTTFVGGKVKSKKTEFTRPSTARLITWERYLKDIRTRWAIHNFEIQELLKDFSKGVDFVKPYHAQMVKMVKTVNL